MSNSSECLGQVPLLTGVEEDRGNHFLTQGGVRRELGRVQGPWGHAGAFKAPARAGGTEHKGICVRFRATIENGDASPNSRTGTPPQNTSFGFGRRFRGPQEGRRVASHNYGFSCVDPQLLAAPVLDFRNMRTRDPRRPPPRAVGSTHWEAPAQTSTAKSSTNGVKVTTSLRAAD